MGAGFQCFGDHGYIQVDENFRNFALINKTIAQAQTWNQIGYQQGSLFDCNWVRYYGASKETLICIYSGSPFAVFNVYEENGRFVYMIACVGQIEIYEFGPPPTSSGSGAGIQVFNDAQQLVFSSDFAYMRVLDFISGNILAQNWNGQNRGYAGSPKCGIVAGCGTGVYDSYQDFPGQWQNYGSMMCNKCIGGGIQVDTTRYSYSQSTSVQGSALQEGKFELLVINLNDL